MCLPLFRTSRSFFARERRLEGLNEVTSCAQKHPSNEICGRNTRRPLHDEETASGLDKAIAILAVAIRGYIISVDHIETAVVRDPGKRSDVGCVRNGLGNPSTCLDGCHSELGRPSSARCMWTYKWNNRPFFEGHDRRALILEDRFIGMDSDKQLLTKPAGLEHCAGMAYRCDSVSTPVSYQPQVVSRSYRDG